MATLVDGLGYDELGDSGDPGSKVTQLWITGSVVTQSDVNVAGNISGAGTLDIGGAAVVDSLNNDDGIVESNIIGSPAVYSSLVQAGFTGPLVAATGSAVFGKAFTNRGYVVTVSPATPVVDGIGSIVPQVTSGITHATTGCTIIGQSGASYHWIAVGLAN